MLRNIRIISNPDRQGAILGRDLRVVDADTGEDLRLPIHDISWSAGKGACLVTLTLTSGQVDITTAHPKMWPLSGQGKVERE